MPDTPNKASQAIYNRQDYVGLLVRTDIPGTLAYLDRCGETARADALRRKLRDPDPYATGDAFLDGVLNAYQDYFRACFSAGLNTASNDDPQTPAAAEPEARRALEQNLQDILDMPGADLDALEDAIKDRLTASGWQFLGGQTGGFYGPYIWQETSQTDYEVELPEGIETLTIFWADGFIMRSWLAWLSDGDTGTGGWAKDEGVYCVRDAYAEILDTPKFNVSFLKHEAQHHADLRRGIESNCELEYRAKLVELIYYPDASFLESLLASADQSDEANAHAWAAGKIVAELAEMLEAEGVEDGMKELADAVRDEKVWINYKDFFSERLNDYFMS
jgi:hypothetical protein